MKQLLQKMMFVFTVLISCQFAQAQSRSVSGKVSDTGGADLPGVSVTVKGTTLGAVTDATGKYTVQAPTNATLVFSYIGYKAQEINIGNKTSVNISLEEDAAALSEVVVVGYGTQKKSQLTSAISQVSAKEINEMPITNLGQAMQGRVAGIDVTQSGSRPGAVPKILIRGRRSFNAGNDPL